MQLKYRIRPFAFLSLNLALLLPAIAARAADPDFLPGVQVGTVAAGAIDEASGLLASRANSGVLWVHNDSGDSARVFAVNTAGTLLGTYTLSGAGATDWEDMASGPGPGGGEHLYLGDIGDNNATRGVSRPPIQVHRVGEPAVASGQSPVSGGLTGVETFTLMYPDGARDAETLIVDPANGDLYVISKRESRSRVYRAPAVSLVDGATITMEYKGQLPWGWATGGDISPDGDEILIRRYSDVSLWSRPPGTSFWEAFAAGPTGVPQRPEPQGEAISFDRDGWGYYTLSEGTSQPIYYFDRVPEPVTLWLLALAAPAVLRRRHR